MPIIVAFLPTIVFLIFFNACRAPKIDLQNLAPENPLVYLETQNLGKTLASLTENQAFRELAAETPDFSRLENIQLAIAVTGFATAENQSADGKSVVNFTPRFVAISETNLWQWQTRRLVENQLNNFIRRNYGADAALEKSEKWNGEFFQWTAADGRRVFAFVKASRIYFGNDLDALERCANRNDANNDSAARKTSERNFPNENENRLANGYVSAEGVKQIADVAAVSVAAGMSEEEAQSFVARVLPPLLRSACEEIRWTMTKTGRGIEDSYQISLKPEIVAVTNETLTTAPVSSSGSIDLLPTNFSSATRYNLKNPLIAWRSLLVLAAKNTDAVSGTLLTRFSGALFEPYGIGDAENFLDSIGSEIVTVQFDETGAQSAAIFTVENLENLKKSVVPEIDFKLAPAKQFEAEIWFSEDRQTAAAFVENQFVIGNGESVLKCLAAKRSGENLSKKSGSLNFSENGAVAVTLASDADSVNRIVEVLAEKKNENRRLATFYSTATRFTAKGIERKTVSDSGLIGTILKQLSD